MNLLKLGLSPIPAICQNLGPADFWLISRSFKNAKFYTLKATAFIRESIVKDRQ